MSKAKLSNPMEYLSKREWALWICSLVVVIASNFVSGYFSGQFDVLTLVAACVGVSALIFSAKGNVWGQILITIFSILYGIISWRFHYWGEMVTYLGMSMPMAIWSTITWVRNPSENSHEVEIQKLPIKKKLIVAIATALVTIAFYFILKAFNTPNLIFSTLSVTTSFAAATLTVMRNSYFALFYALNDLVLIVLWVLASIENPLYIPVVVNFVIFFLNDMYGFISWKKREKKQM